MIYYHTKCQILWTNDASVSPTSLVRKISMALVYLLPHE